MNAIKNFICNYLTGQAFNPVVITAELCCRFQDGSGGTCYVWRSVTEVMAILTGREESVYRTAFEDSKARMAVIGKKGPLNGAQSLMQVYTTGNHDLLGGRNILGLDGNGVYKLKKLMDSMTAICLSMDFGDLVFLVRKQL